MEFSVTKSLINNEFTYWKQRPPGSTTTALNGGIHIVLFLSGLSSGVILAEG